LQVLGSNLKVSHRAAGEAIEFNENPIKYVKNTYTEVKRFFTEMSFPVFKSKMSDMTERIEKGLNVLKTNYIDILEKDLQEDKSDGIVSMLSRRAKFATFSIDLNRFFERDKTFILGDLHRVLLPKLATGLNNAKINPALRGRIENVFAEIDSFAGDYSRAYKDDYRVGTEDKEKLATALGMLKLYYGNYTRVLEKVQGIVSELEEID